MSEHGEGAVLLFTSDSEGLDWQLPRMSWYESNTSLVL